MQGVVLDEEQALLARSAREMLNRRSPLSRVRRLRDVGAELGFSTDVWQEMVSLGWASIPFSETDGGLGLGLAHFALVTEALGRVLAPEPLISSVGLAGQAIARAAESDQRSRWLPGLIEGTHRAVLAYEEPGRRFSRVPESCRAAPSGDGFVLRGEKTGVLDGVGAELLVVSARLEGGPALFVVGSGAPGVEVIPLRRLDARNAARVSFVDVEVSARDVLAGPDTAHRVIDQVIDWATVALCAEMLGSMSRAFELTVAYLKDRTQFGVPVGSFQALQHRAAAIFVEHELARAAVMTAARHLDANGSEGPAWVSAAKARCNDAFLLTANEAIQMHGGIGMTDEHDIGLFLKRARVAEMTFGDSAYHRDRFARRHAY